MSNVVYSQSCRKLDRHVELKSVPSAKLHFANTPAAQVNHSLHSSHILTNETSRDKSTVEPVLEARLDVQVKVACAWSSP